MFCSALHVCLFWVVFLAFKKKIGMLKVYFTKPQQINTDLFQTILQMNVLQMPPHSMQRFRYTGTDSAKDAL